MNKILAIFLLTALHLQSIAAPPPIDLEAGIQTFVLETKKIEISGYPDAFNPSLIRWSGNLLLSFRIYDPITKSTPKMGFIWLDENFDIASTPIILDIPPEHAHLPAWAQDPRLVAMDDDLYIVYNNVHILENLVRRMCVAKLKYDGEAFTISSKEEFLHFEGENPKKQEKNWVPFIYEGKFLLAYSLSPHLIFEPQYGTSSCKSIAASSSTLSWQWGILRGGTPALLVDGEYLAFFHSCKAMTTLQSKGVQMTHYFMGAYTFAANPPFAITRISPEPIIGKNFYNGPAHNTWKPLRVVFPGGFVFDENYIWVAYGRQDHEIWIVKMDKMGLMNSLKSCQNVAH